MEKRTKGKNGNNKQKVCPFRVNSKIEYGLFEGVENPVVTSEQYEYAPCYEEGCPFWQYEVGIGYRCTQVENIGGNEYVQE